MQPAPRSDLATSLSELVRLSAEKKDSTGIDSLLEFLAKAAGADGCIFWQLAPSADLSAKPPLGRFFPVASWCRFSDIHPWYFLPAKSITGEACLAGKPVVIPSIDEVRDRIDSEALRLVSELWRMKSCAAAPVENRPAKRAVTFYKRDGPLDEGKVEEAAFLAAHVPVLFDAIAEREFLHFVEDLDEVLYPASAKVSSDQAGYPESRGVALSRLKQTCRFIRERFNCVEACIFLTDHPLGRGPFRLLGADWRWEEAPSPTQYEEGQGLTGWVLANRRAIEIQDLHYYDADEEWIQRTYPAVKWENRFKVALHLRKLLGLKDTDELPPVSFLCVPVFHGRLLGALRVSTRLASPRSFTPLHRSMLEVAAAFLGGWWKDWLVYSHGERTLQSVADRIVTVHRQAGRQLTESRREPEALLRATLESAVAVLPEIAGGALWLRDADREELHFSSGTGPLWDQASATLAASIRQQKVPLSPSPGRPSAVAHVIDSDRGYIINDLESAPYSWSTFPHTRRLLLAPIRSGGRIEGVLNLARTEELDFDGRDLALAEVFAAQIGLYLDLARQLASRSSLEDKLRRQNEEQLRTIENLRHQIRTPITTAAQAIRRLVKSNRCTGERDKLLAVRRELTHCEHMVKALELFAALANDKAPRVKLSTIQPSELLTKIEVLSLDHQNLAPSSWNLRFEVAAPSILELGRHVVQADIGLLEHALANLLDNARKYSLPNTMVTISAGLMDYNRYFYLSVLNVGLRIHPDDVREMTKRGWRSNEAWKSAGEGDGIGLWIVDAIMKAHGGRLQITPTDRQGRNEFRLVFPAGPRNL